MEHTEGRSWEAKSNNIEHVDKSLDIPEIERHLTETLPLESIEKIFGPETFLIGGGVRDVVWGKDLVSSDLDFMSRLPYESAIANLKINGFRENRGGRNLTIRPTLSNQEEILLM